MELRKFSGTDIVFSVYKSCISALKSLSSALHLSDNTLCSIVEHFCGITDTKINIHININIKT